MIEISKTKGIIGYIKVEIYHNNQKIDLDSIEQEFNEDLRTIEKSEDYYLKELKK